jgi:hypothetical protein
VAFPPPREVYLPPSEANLYLWVVFSFGVLYPLSCFHLVCFGFHFHKSLSLVLVLGMVFFFFFFFFFFFKGGVLLLDRFFWLSGFPCNITKGASGYSRQVVVFISQLQGMVCRSF